MKRQFYIKGNLKDKSANAEVLTFFSDQINACKTTRLAKIRQLDSVNHMGI